MSMTTVKTPINKDFEPDQYPTQTRKGDTVSLYSNELLLASTMDQKKSHRKGVPGGDWNQENDTRFANITKVSGEFVSDKVYSPEEVSKGQWKHEEKLVLDLIQPGGARSCPSDQLLQEFSKACEFLEPAVVGSILINTLRDSQVSSNNKAKAVCGIDSLIRSHNKYRRYFTANCAILEGITLTDNETVVKDLLSTVVQNLKSGKPGREMLKRAQTAVITTPKPDVDLMNFDDNTLAGGDKSTKSKFGFIRSSNVATPLNAVTPQNGSGVFDLMSLDVSMTAPTPKGTDGWKGQVNALPSPILGLYQQHELQQPQPQQVNGRAVPVIPPLHTMGAFLWDDVQSMQGHQLESSSGIKPASVKKMDEREKAFDFIQF